jgi:NADH-quinone oxidoreductase subunit A
LGAVAQYLPILFMLVLATLFSGLSFFASSVLSPRRTTAAKQAPYECGIVPQQDPVERFPVRFYVVAMLFIIFDIEIIFLYPWAVSFGALGLFGLLAMSVFAAIS